MQRTRILLVNNSSGQALLIILLIMAVSLTIGLSVVSRSITDVQISQQTEEAARAFSAAEAGIEEALVTAGSSFGGSFTTGATYTATVVGLSSGAEFVFPQPVSVNEPQAFWFREHNADGSLGGAYYDRDEVRVLWGNSGTAVNGDRTPALEVIIYYLDGAVKTAIYVLDPNPTRFPDPSFCNPSEIGSSPCTGVSNFSTSGETASDQSLQFAATLDLSGFTEGSKSLYFARLRLLYLDTDSSHLLGLKSAGLGSNDFPSQGSQIDSIGQSGDAMRKVEVVRFYPAPPSIFDFAMFSVGSLAK